MLIPSPNSSCHSRIEWSSSLKIGIVRAEARGGLLVIRGRLVRPGLGVEVLVPAARARSSSPTPATGATCRTCRRTNAGCSRGRSRAGSRDSSSSSRRCAGCRSRAPCSGRSACGGCRLPPRPAIPRAAACRASTSRTPDRRTLAAELLQAVILEPEIGRQPALAANAAPERGRLEVAREVVDPGVVDAVELLGFPELLAAHEVARGARNG